jgi:hypothetical protein
MRRRYDLDKQRNSAVYNSRSPLVRTSRHTAAEADPSNLNTWNFEITNAGLENGVWYIRFDNPSGRQQVSHTVTGVDTPTTVITALDTALAAFDPADISVTDNGTDLDIVSSREGYDLDIEVEYVHPSSASTEAPLTTDYSTLLENIAFDGSSYGVPCHTQERLIYTFFGHDTVTAALASVHVFDGAMWHLLLFQVSVATLFTDDTVDLTSYSRVYVQLKTFTGTEVYKLVGVV